jgi:hypothetical protein
MLAQQETSRGNISVTFCGVGLPAEGSLSLVNVGRWSVKRELWLRSCLAKHRLQQRGMAFNGSFADDCPYSLYSENESMTVVRKDRWWIRDQQDLQVLSVPPKM